METRNCERQVISESNGSSISNSIRWWRGNDGGQEVVREEEVLGYQTPYEEARSQLWTGGQEAGREVADCH